MPLKPLKLGQTYASPFMFPGGLDPLQASQYRVCALVEQTGDATIVRREAHNGRKEPLEATLLAFDVKVIEGVGVRAGEIRHCLTVCVRPTSVDSKSKRFLLFGWTNGQSSRLQIEYREFGLGYRPGDVQKYVEADKETLYAGSLLPTSQEHVVTGNSPATRTYYNIVSLLAGNPSPSLVREMSWAFAGSAQDKQAKVEGETAYDWFVSNLGPKLERLPMSAPFRRRSRKSGRDWPRGPSTRSGKTSTF